MGFHKILKKHDRRLPNPCKEFYMARLHDQSWVRGDFSDVMVTMSRVYSKLRGDEAKEAQDTEKQVITSLKLLLGKLCKPPLFFFFYRRISFDRPESIGYIWKIFHSLNTLYCSIYQSSYRLRWMVKQTLS